MHENFLRTGANGRRDAGANLPAVMEPVTAGWNYDKDDDGEVDPLDELLDAYQGFVRAGMVELANMAMEIVHDLQEMMIGKGRKPDDYYTSKDHGYSNPVSCLAMAHLALLKIPAARAIADKVRDLLDAAANAMFGRDEQMSDGDDEMVDEGQPRLVQRVVRQEGDQYCVYSETGRSFGCYSSRDRALERLAQIETFSAAATSGADAKSLIQWHDAAHNVKSVTPAVKTVHDIICDVLEVEHGLAEPYTLTLDDKVAMLGQLSAGLVSKAAEYRYTLGPAYVPNREDAHGEFADAATLQAAMWDWVRKGDRTIYLQHSEKAAGEMVEMMTLPFPLEAELEVPGEGVTKYTFPADTPFLGVVWEPWAWDMVKAGQLRGYSIGGTAKRVEADLPFESTV